MQLGRAHNNINIHLSLLLDSIYFDMHCNKTDVPRMTEPSPFQVPPGQEITVKLINPVNFGPAQLHRFMGPPVPGMETHPSNPSFSFLLEHPSGRKLVFDLGIRKDYLNYAPKIAEYIPTTNYNIEVTKNVVDILEEDGISAGDVEAVIWR